MTFRTRLVLASTTAVVVAVLLAAFGAFLIARNSLVGSLDDSLQVRAQTALHQGFDPDTTHFYGDKIYVVPEGAPPGTDPLPVNKSVQAVAAGRTGAYFDTVSVDGKDYRELVIPLPAGTQLQLNQSEPCLFNGCALQWATPMSGVNSQLTRLGLALAAVAIGGVLLSLLLGWLVARATLGPLNDLTGSVEEIAKTTDVTQRLDPGGVDELGRLRRAFNRMLAALELSREAQRQLVLDASHELRTPLTSLRTNLEVARRIDELPPADRELLVSDVLTQMEELTHLVGDMAELARGEQPKRTVAPLRLDQLVADAVAVAATHGRHRGVTFAPQLEPTWVAGQQDRISRAVGNLLDNALKWSPDHGVVEVSCTTGEVVVRDHGPGIDPSDLPHVFDRFYRAPAARGLPGSGLGLAIVAQVAEDEGGWVSAERAPGGGALFRFRLPVIPAPLGVTVDD